MQWTYWRRWAGEPLAVVATYRVADQVVHVLDATIGDWVEVPGEYVLRAIGDGDAMFDRLGPGEVARLAPPSAAEPPTDSPLTGDRPRFRATR